MDFRYIALYARFLGDEQRAETHAPMMPKGSASGKYLTVAAPITDAQIEAHILGHETHAIKLIGRDGLARAWAVDVDEGGPEAVRARVAALAAAGLPCIGIAGQGAQGHDGGHIWGIYARPVEYKAAQAQIRAALDAAGLPTQEIWPSGQPIRAPFGVHTHTGRRGMLLRPGMPDVSLDMPDGLALGLDTLAALEPTPTPPPLPKAKPPSVASATHTTPPSGTVGSVRDLIAAFNRDHPMAQLLSGYGAQQTREGWACNCGIEHTHETQLVVTDQGKAIFFSARCWWAPARTDRNGRPIADSFDIFTQVEHGGDKSAALRILRGAQPRRAAVPAPEGTDRRHTAPEAVEARQRDAQRKRDARQAEAAITLQSVRDRAAEDTTLTACDRAVLHALIDIADDRDWCRPSKPRLAELTGYALGSVKTALSCKGRLEGRYFTSQGDGGGSRDTAIRTFLRGSCVPPKAVEAPDVATGIMVAEDGAAAPDVSTGIEMIHEFSRYI